MFCIDHRVSAAVPAGAVNMYVPFLPWTLNMTLLRE